MGWDRQRQNPPPLPRSPPDGTKLLSRRVVNDEPELLQLLTDVLDLADKVIWAVDMADGGAALMIAPLVNHDQELLCIPGRAVNRATDSYRGQGRPTPATRSSSPIRPARVGSSNRCGPATRRPSNSSCSPAAAPISSATALTPTAA